MRTKVDVIPTASKTELNVLLCACPRLYLLAGTSRTIECKGNRFFQSLARFLHKDTEQYLKRGIIKLGKNVLPKLLPLKKKKKHVNKE